MSWELIASGRFEEAVAALRESDWSKGRNLGTALLCLGRYEEALQTYLGCIESDRQKWLLCDGDFLMAGFCLWCQGRAAQAVETWREGWKTPYTDAAGGVIVPAVLFYAALKLHDQVLRREAIQKLKKRWKPKLEQIWPGPISGFLLRAIPPEDFVSNRTFQNETLENRRACQAFFWAGVRCLDEQDPEGARSFFVRSSQVRDPGGAHLLELEFFLACHEVGVAPGQSRQGSCSVTEVG